MTNKLGLRLGAVYTYKSSACAHPSGAKFNVPSWCAKSPDLGAALHVVKNGGTIGTLRLDKYAYYILGRNPRCPDARGVGYTVDHPTISRQHAALVHGENGQLYVIDLNSAHGTFICGKRIQSFVPEILENGKLVSFGLSTRSYLVRLFPSKESILGLPSSLSFTGGLHHDEEVTQEPTYEDQQTIVHTNVNSFLSCIPDDEDEISLGLSSSTRHTDVHRARTKTRGGSLGSDPCFAGTGNNKGARTCIKNRRVSFSASRPEIIPLQTSGDATKHLGPGPALSPAKHASNPDAAKHGMFFVAEEPACVAENTGDAGKSSATHTVGIRVPVDQISGEGAIHRIVNRPQDPKTPKFKSRAESSPAVLFNNGGFGRPEAPSLKHTFSAGTLLTSLNEVVGSENSKLLPLDEGVACPRGGNKMKRGRSPLTPNGGNTMMGKPWVAMSTSSPSLATDVAGHLRTGFGSALDSNKVSLDSPTPQRRARASTEAFPAVVVQHNNGRTRASTSVGDGEVTKSPSLTLKLNTTVFVSSPSESPMTHHQCKRPKVDWDLRVATPIYE